MDGIPPIYGGIEDNLSQWVYNILSSDYQPLTIIIYIYVYLVVMTMTIGFIIQYCII